MKEAVIHAIFMELHKAYYSLDRSKCLYILEGYSVGTRAIHLFHRYWYRLKMVAQAGGKYGEPFRGEIGVIQGDPMLTTIFNVVVEAVICHRESLVAEWKGRDSSNDEGDVAQTGEGKTRDQYDG